MTKIFSLTSITAAGIMALSSMAFAADEYNVSNGLTLDGNPLGIHGADPVAFIKTGHATAGLAEFAAVHDGVEYYFSTADAKAAFEASPDAYLPQNGGFCTLGISVRKKLDGDTRYADIREGKLYLFVNAAVFAAYQEDKDAVIAKADEVWQEIRSTSIEEL